MEDRKIRALIKDINHKFNIIIESLSTLKNNVDTSQTKENEKELVLLKRKIA